MNNNLIKNIAISLLFVLAVLIILVAIFYDKLAVNKIVSEPQAYEPTEQIIQDVNDETDAETTEIVKTYEVNGSMMRSYEATKEYVRGKEYPFELFSYKATDENENTTSNSTNPNGGGTAGEPATIK